MHKRGSHVGVVLSFVVFVTFLVFLYSIIMPVTKKQKDKQFILDYLKKEIIEQLYSNLTVSSIKINEDYDPTVSGLDVYGCFEINNLAQGNVVVKDEQGNIVDSVVSVNKLKIKWDDSNKRFFKIYYSNEFDSNGFSGTTCVFLVKDDYTIGLIKTEQNIFNNSIKNLLQTNYDELKTKLDVPENYEFNFEFGGIAGGYGGEVPKKDIYAEEVPIEYIDSNANINFGKMLVRVW